MNGAPTSGGFWGEDRPTLMSRLGGFSVLSRVIDAFYARLLSDTSLSPFFQGISLDRLHEKQIKFCSFAFGGANQYFGRDIAYAHRDLILQKGLNLSHFDKLIAHFVAACKECGVAQDCADEARMILSATRPIFDPKNYARFLPNPDKQNQTLQNSLASMKASSSEHHAGQVPGTVKPGPLSDSNPTEQARAEEQQADGVHAALYATSLPGAEQGSSKLAHATQPVGPLSADGTTKKRTLKLSQLAKVLAPALAKATPTPSPTASGASGSSGKPPAPKALTRRDKLNMLLQLLKPEEKPEEPAHMTPQPQQAESAIAHAGPTSPPAKVPDGEQARRGTGAGQLSSEASGGRREVRQSSALVEALQSTGPTETQPTGAAAVVHAMQRSQQTDVSTAQAEAAAGALRFTQMLAMASRKGVDDSSDDGSSYLPDSEDSDWQGQGSSNGLRTPVRGLPRRRGSGLDSSGLQQDSLSRSSIEYGSSPQVTNTPLSFSAAQARLSTVAEGSEDGRGGDRSTRLHATGSAGPATLLEALRMGASSQGSRGTSNNTQPQVQLSAAMAELGLQEGGGRSRATPGAGAVGVSATQLPLRAPGSGGSSATSSGAQDGHTLAGSPAACRSCSQQLQPEHAQERAAGSSAAHAAQDAAPPRCPFAAMLTAPSAHTAAHPDTTPGGADPAPPLAAVHPHGGVLTAAYLNERAQRPGVTFAADPQGSGGGPTAAARQLVAAFRDSLRHSTASTHSNDMATCGSSLTPQMLSALNTIMSTGGGVGEYGDGPGTHHSSHFPADVAASTVQELQQAARGGGLGAQHGSVEEDLDVMGTSQSGDGHERASRAAYDTRMSSAMSSMASDGARSLYDKLGTTERITHMVEVFYTKLISDPDLAPFFEGVDIAHLSRKQALFLAFIFGGANEWTGRDIAATHAPLVRKGLNLDHFDRFASHFIDALVEIHLDFTLVDEATMALMGLRHVFDPDSILDLEAQGHSMH